MKDRLGKDLNVGDFIIYVTKTEAPSLQFGYVEKIGAPAPGGYRGQQQSVRIAHTNPDGTQLNVVRFEYDPILRTGEHVDTGKQRKSTLTVWGEGNDDRFMIIDPIK